VDEVAEFSARHKRLRRRGQEVRLRADHGGGQGARRLTDSGVREAFPVEARLAGGSIHF
jgi:hypothetical protein